MSGRFSYGAIITLVKRTSCYGEKIYINKTFKICKDRFGILGRESRQHVSPFCIDKYFVRKKRVVCHCIVSNIVAKFNWLIYIIKQAKVFMVDSMADSNEMSFSSIKILNVQLTPPPPK